MFEGRISSHEFARAVVRIYTDCQMLLLMGVTMAGSTRRVKCRTRFLVLCYQIHPGHQFPASSVECQRDGDFGACASNPKDIVRVRGSKFNDGLKMLRTKKG